MKILDIPQSGKRGSTVSQHGPYGQVSRARVLPANPRTPAQMLVRNLLTQVTRRWGTLQETQRLAWRAAAKGLRSTSRLGQNGPLNGYLLFTRLNCNLARFGQAQADLPPARPEFPEPAPTSLVISNSGVLSLRLTCPTAPGADTIVRASAPLSPGCGSCPDVVILGLCPAPTQGSIDITALYIARFGIPPARTRIFVQVNQLIAGWEDPPREFSALVPEAA